MRIKKIKLNRITDEHCKEIVRLGAGYLDDFDLSIARGDNVLIIRFLDNEFTISWDGSLGLEVDGEDKRILFIGEIIHLIAETQWIKESEKVPAHGKKIILKAKTDNGFVIYNCELFSEPPREGDGGYPMIYYMAENNSDGISFDLFDINIIGWIDAKNVEL